MKAIKVIFKENAEIVIASSSNFLDFCAAVRETFNLPMIEEVKWNSCKVNASSFAALINEQNLEFTIQAPQLVDILNSQQVSLELNKADTAQSSPLCQFSSIVNDYVDFVVPSNKINWNFENQCIAEECHVNVVQPPVSQLSTSVAQYMAEECRVNVVQPPVRQISSSTSSSSSPNTPKTPRKVINYNCSVCYCITSTYSFMLHHLKLHGNQAAVFCEICLSKFKSLSGFLKHSKKCSINQINICTIENEVENDVVNQIGNTKINEDYLGALALHLQGKHRCAQNVLNIIFSNLKEMLSVLNVDIEALKATCDKLSTQYLREKYYKNNLQTPTAKVVGLNKQGCIIPFIEILSFLLQSQEINDFTAVNGDTNHMKIGIYCDDLGITNPLGKARKKQKMFVFHFQILNIPSLYRGRTSSIFPLIFTLTKWVKDKYFYSILFSDFISSISQLENGIVIKVRGVSKIITVEVVYFSGDSLSANAIGGFKEGFSEKTLRCCRSCNSTRQQMKDFSNHEECSIRNAPEHMIRLTELNSGLSKADKSKY
ncbi:uncharacterized protein LOC136081674 isoform X1 [Hydra vulgaris]|uniref:Uncharacterized protein LOC136081674 isoform X1 n=1 Tax=Hydra vulgaris TaxID=6087 RepID=A0ABM4C1K5_HYDVU